MEHFNNTFIVLKGLPDSYIEVLTQCVPVLHDDDLTIVPRNTLGDDIECDQMVIRLEDLLSYEILI